MQSTRAQQPGKGTAVPAPASGLLLLLGPQGEPGPKGENSVLATASFFAFERRFENGKAVPLVTGTEDETGQIRLMDETAILLEPGRYAVWYRLSTVLENPGYLQVTPSQNGSSQLAYGVYVRTASPMVTAGGTNFLLLKAEDATAFQLNYNSDVANRSGEASVMVWKLAEFG